MFSGSSSGACNGGGGGGGVLGGGGVVGGVNGSGGGGGAGRGGGGGGVVACEGVGVGSVVPGDAGVSGSATERGVLAAVAGLVERLLTEGADRRPSAGEALKYALFSCRGL